MHGAVTAPGAFVRVNVSGMVCECGSKVPWFTLNGLYFTVGYQIDIQMPADLDQFR